MPTILATARMILACVMIVSVVNTVDIGAIAVVVTLRNALKVMTHRYPYSGSGSLGLY